MRLRWRAALAIVAAALLLLAIALDGGPFPRSLHLWPRLPLLLLAAGLALVTVYRQAEDGRLGRWLLALAVAILLLLVALPLAFWGTAALVVVAGRLRGENAMGAIVPGLIAAVLVGPLVATLVLAWLQRRIPSLATSATPAGLDGAPTAPRRQRLGEAATLLTEAAGLALAVVTVTGSIGAFATARNQGETLLHWAAREHDPRLVGWLLERGAAPDVRRVDGETPLLAAIRGCSGHRGSDPADLTAVLTALLGAGADPNATDQTGQPALVRVLYRTDAATLVPQLLAAGADPDRGAMFEGPPLHVVAEHGSSELVHLLLDGGATVDLRDAAGRTPLMRAAGRPVYRNESEQLAIVERLLAAGADPTATDTEGRGVLHWAAVGRNPRAVEALLAAGASPTLVDHHGRRPLDLLTAEPPLRRADEHGIYGAAPSPELVTLLTSPG